MEPSDVRRRIRAAIESARKGVQERRARSEIAGRDYGDFLRDRAVPVFQVVAAALAAEGHRFKIFTPAESVRLAAESSQDDFIEIALDPTVDPPVVVGRVSRGRGRRSVASERPIRGDAAIADLTQEDVLDFVVGELPPFVER